MKLHYHFECALDIRQSVVGKLCREAAWTRRKYSETITARDTDANGYSRSGIDEGQRKG